LLIVLKEGRPIEWFLLKAVAVEEVAAILSLGDQEVILSGLIIDLVDRLEVTVPGLMLLGLVFSHIG
jgi:hypothetical protein